VVEIEGVKKEESRYTTTLWGIVILSSSILNELALNIVVNSAMS
jgi:hypothetical protein